MDRNAEICQNAIDYAFSVYLRANETKERFIKEFGDQVKAIQYLRNRGLLNQASNTSEPTESRIQYQTSGIKHPESNRQTNQELLF